MINNYFYLIYELRTVSQLSSKCRIHELLHLSLRFSIRTMQWTSSDLPTLPKCSYRVIIVEGQALKLLPIRHGCRKT